MSASDDLSGRHTPAPGSEERAIREAVSAAISDGVMAGVGTVAGALLFEDRGPIAHVGRNSIPKSYRGEGQNFVD